MKQNVKNAVALAVQAGLPPLIVSEPGAGKTAFFHSLGKQLGLEVFAIYGSCRSPEDIGGYPLCDAANKTISLVPAGVWQKRLLELGKGILFIDELSSNNGSMQAAMMALIHEGRAGDITFSPEVVRVAAMNPSDQAAGGFDLAAPLANRMIHIPWVTDPETVIQGFLDGFENQPVLELPKDWKSHKANAAALVAGYLRRFPDQVHAFPKEESKRSEPWPSPRSWYEFAIPSIAACTAAKASEDVLAILLCGSVGQDIGFQFLTWRRELDLPDPEELLKDPKKFVIADRHDKVFTTLSAVVAAAVGNLTPERWTNAWKILHTVASAGHTALAATACRSLARARTSKMPSASEWIAPFRELIEAAKL